MLSFIKNLFVEDEETAPALPLPNTAGGLVKEDFRAKLRSEILIDYVDQDKLFCDYLAPSILIQFQKRHFQAIYYVDSIDKRLRFRVMEQLNLIYGTKQNIEIERVINRISETWNVRLHSDEYATRASTWDKSPYHDKMTRIISHVRNGGLIERPNIKRPEIATEPRTYQETAISMESAAQNEIAESLRESLLRRRCGTKRDNGGNGESGGFHPI